MIFFKVLLSFHWNVGWAFWSWKGLFERRRKTQSYSLLRLDSLRKNSRFSTRLLLCFCRNPGNSVSVVLNVQPCELMCCCIRKIIGIAFDLASFLKRREMIFKDELNKIPAFSLFAFSLFVFDLGRSLVVACSVTQGFWLIHGSYFYIN